MDTFKTFFSKSVHFFDFQKRVEALSSLFNKNTFFFFSTFGSCFWLEEIDNSG